MGEWRDPEKNRWLWLWPAIMIAVGIYLIAMAWQAPDFPPGEEYPTGQPRATPVAPTVTLIPTPTMRPFRTRGTPRPFYARQPCPLIYTCIPRDEREANHPWH